MKSNSRRSFIRNTSWTATGVLFMSAAKVKKKEFSESAIGCGPARSTQLTGTITSTKSGNWSDPTTWGGRVPVATDTPLIASGHTVVYDVTTATLSGVNVNNGGTLSFDPSKTTTLQSNRNIIIEGNLLMRPSSAAIVHTIRFININESLMVGGGMSPLATDVGLWVTGAGKLDILGAEKKPWTRTTGSVNIGATSFTVVDATGWRVGDEVVIVPTDTPGLFNTDYIDATDTLIDHYFVKFERRIITAINGNTISFVSPLQYQHLSISSSIQSSLGNSSRTWTPEVANLSRNARIEGTITGRSHIFIRSSVPQNIRYLQGRFLGPRKKEAGARRPTLIAGRYGLHFHHCYDGSRGSMVYGCAFFEIGNRCYVPHVSHGVTMNNNVSFDTLEQAFWWDFQEVTHDCTWDDNLIAAARLNGVDKRCSGMILQMGDGNVARRNVAVYANSGDNHNGGAAFLWEADTEGVWVFEDNMAHSCTQGILVWQNTSNNHTVINYDSYNCHEGISHGAYGNSYTYRGGHHYNSVIFNKASSTNTSGVVFQDIFCDAAGTRFCGVTIDSPIPSHPVSTNKWINCVFRNYTVAPIELCSTMPDSNIEKQFKFIDIICCDFPTSRGFAMVDNNLYPLKNNSRVRVQPISGQSHQTVKSSGQYITSNILPFAPTFYGKGTGLMGEYFNGSNFNAPAFKREDSMIMFQQWSIDPKVSPTGVHYSITNKDLYSIRWTGQVQPQFTEPYTFYVEGSGGHRLWVENKLIIDSWFEKADNKDMATSIVLNLVAGQKYDIKLEHFNANGARACMLHWKCPSLPVISVIPQCQLYSNVTVTPPPPVANQNPVANAGADITIVLPTNSTTLNGTASIDNDGSITAYKWSRLSGPTQFTLATPNSVNSALSNLVEGTYIFQLEVTDDKGAIHQDTVSVIVKPAEPANRPPVANAGPDMVITLPANSTTLNGSASSDPDGTIAAYQWTRISGPATFTIANTSGVTTALNNLVEGVYVFRLQVTDSKGATHEDDVTITVQPAPTQTNKSPVANAGNDVTITLPVNSTTLNGTASMDPDGTITAYRWTKVGGPTQFIIANPIGSSTSVSNLVAGVYTFRLQVTDSNGATHEDDVTVTVLQAPTTQQNTSPDTFVLNVTPNPSTNIFRVEIRSNVDLPITATLFNAWGKQVHQIRNFQRNTTVTIPSNLEKGTYVLVAEQGFNKRTATLIKL